MMSQQPATIRTLNALSLPGLVLVWLAAGCASPTPPGVAETAWSPAAESTPAQNSASPTNPHTDDVYTTAGEIGETILPVEVNPAQRQLEAQRALATDPAKAERLFEEILDSHPTDPTALLGLGLARLALKDAAGAAEALEQAHGFDRSPRITAALGVAYDALGQHDRAQQLYRAALERRPNDVETLNNLGVSYTKDERFREAVYVFRGALTLRPGNAGLENNLGFALGRLGRYDDALRHFRAAGTPSEAFNNQGYVAFLNGDHRRAIEYYERALAVAQDEKLTIIRNLHAARKRLEARGASDPRRSTDLVGTEIGAAGEGGVQAWRLH